jgi:hypothetical protein
MNERRQGNWYLLTGVLIGLVAGLVISLLLSPVRYNESEPSALAESAKSLYRQMVAQAYQANGNIPRAQGRLSLLGDGDPNRALAAQAQRILGEGGSPDEARALAALAAVLNGVAAPESASVNPTPPADGGTPQAAGETPIATSTIPVGGIEPAVQTATPERPTATPLPTFTPRPTATPPRVLDAPFTLTNKVQVCDSSLPPGRLAVIVTGRDDTPLPGVPVQVTWGEGQSSTFYTGLAPEISSGYADFQMQPGTEYTLKVGEASEAVSGLSIPTCGGGWRVEFKEAGN